MRTIAIVMALASAPPVFALDPSKPLSSSVHAAWSIQDGLPSGLVWAIAQDRDGYLWVGTDTGLVRFDGVRFSVVNEPSLATASIRALLTTANGDLWIGTSDGLIVRLSRGHAQRFDANDGAPLSINGLIEDSHHRVWAGGRGGLAVFSDGKWQKVGSEFGLSDEVVTGLYEDDAQTLWVAGSAHLHKRPKDSSRFEVIATPFVVRTLCTDAAGHLWAVSAQQAIGRLQAGPDEDRKRSWADVGGWRIIRDRHGTLWVATLGRGLLRLTFGDPTADPLIQSSNRDLGLTSDSVRAVFEDREGNLWVGTQDGLNRISDTTIVTISDPAELSQPVRAVTPGTDGAVWIGTDNGVYRAVDGRMRRFGREQGLPSVVVGAVHTDRRGVLWVATDHGGLARFDGTRDQFRPVPLSSAIRRVWAMTSDDEGGLWLCEVDGGLFRWVDGRLTSFSSDPAVGRKFGTSAFTDRSGRVWIGFSDGTVAVHDGSAFREYTSKDGLAEGAVGAIYEDSNGDLWVGAAGGLRKLSEGKFVPLTWSPPLPLRNVRAIIEDPEHYLWLGVSGGLIRIDHRTHSFTTYDRSDGLQGMPMSVGGAPTSATTGDGILWFVTSSGIASLDTRRVERSRLPPPVHIERVIVDDHDTAAVSSMRLPPMTSRLEIDYTGLNFAAPSKVRFRYMLEGFDRTWVEAGTRRQAFYTNLPPRHYRFHVVAENDGVSNKTGASWEFSIAPTFYQTSWFLGALMAGGLGATVFAWQVRVRKVQARFAAVIAERARVAREIHDTLLQSLVGVAFQFDTAFSELDESLPDAKKRLSRLRDQIEEAIREARHSIWELRTPVGPRPDLATALRKASERVTGSSHRVSVCVSGNPVSLPRAEEEALVRIATEALRNCVRHAPDSTVEMQLVYAPDTVSLSVRDDGCGFDQSAPRPEHHWGLITMRERAAQIRARLMVESAVAEGTKVTVVLPLNDQRLPN